MLRWPDKMLLTEKLVRRDGAINLLQVLQKHHTEYIYLVILCKACHMTSIDQCLR